ncbi:frizzled-10-A-like [Mercenaria mercenaria]|uniref:frizzled-10-A-like n=1 Tax=Mercenaria mercenaria TaxID=6596 RepID=UPI00234E6E9B|nr:frizzled-10-A-like [Mercenaria mercenaria]
MGLQKTFCVCFAMILVSVVTSQSEDIETVDAEDDGEEIRLPMCRNFLPYSWTKLPNRFGHDTQVEVYRHIQHHWAYMDYGCSNNFRQFVCSFYLPKYDPQTQTSVGPCREMCTTAKKKCKKTMRQTRSRWPRQFKCRRLPSKRNDDTCLRPVNESTTNLQHTYCVDNTIPMCLGLNTLGSLPNFFLQRSLEEITTEMGFYEELVSSNCHQHLRFFLCGTFLPFCVPHITPFATPCRELCEEIRTNCSTHFDFIYQGLPWPNKLQCHRYVSSEDPDRYCALPGDI